MRGGLLPFVFRSGFRACAGMCLLISIASCGRPETAAGGFNGIEAGFDAVDAVSVAPGVDDTELSALLGRVVSLKGEFSMAPEGEFILSSFQRGISIRVPDDGTGWIGCQGRTVLLVGMLGRESDSGNFAITRVRSIDAYVDDPAGQEWLVHCDRVEEVIGTGAPL